MSNSELRTGDPIATLNPLPLYQTETFVLNEATGYLMRLAVNSLRGQMERRMEPHDLTAMQWQPLYMIDQGQADTAADLARQMQVDTGAVTRMLDRLEAKEFVRRERSEQDRRVVHLTLTDAGKSAAKTIPQVMCDVLNDHLRGFDSQELMALHGFLNRILANGSES